MTHLRIRIRADARFVVAYRDLSHVMIDPDFDEVANDHDPTCEGLDHLLHHYREGATHAQQ